MRSKYRLTQFIFKFAEALYKQLEGDQKRVNSAELSYGDEWRQLPKEGQEDRIFSRFEQYWVEFSREGLPIPWLKVAGLAMIAWVRDNYPETLDKRYVDPD